jgi:CheY-like chemotaxis protein
VNADPTRIQQVIMNLAVNARDAMPGGGQLHITIDEFEVKPSTDPPLPDLTPGAWVRIRVQDTGTGIPPDVLPHIFEPFFTTKSVGKGSGLGLAQVYGIVRQHEGILDVRTKVDEGTTFIIYLPHIPNQQTPKLDSTTRTTVKGQRETILVVEDNASLRVAVVNALETLNYQVLETSNGQKALAILESQPNDIDLILSDLVMPEMGGKALLNALHERGLKKPMVIMSGHPMEHQIDNLQARGLAGWISKPLDLNELGNLLGPALDQHR